MEDHNNRNYEAYNIANLPTNPINIDVGPIQDANQYKPIEALNSNEPRQIPTKMPTAVVRHQEQQFQVPVTNLAALLPRQNSGGEQSAQDNDFGAYGNDDLISSKKETPAQDRSILKEPPQYENLPNQNSYSRQARQESGTGQQTFGQNSEMGGIANDGQLTSQFNND